MLEMAVARVKAHEKRENMLKQEIEEEVETVRTFITEVFISVKCHLCETLAAMRILR